MEISKIAIGTMRLPNRETAVRFIRKAIDYGFNYLDTAPLYRLQSAEENSEAWVGEALQISSYRERALVSIKCGTGNGGMKVGEHFEQEKGFGVRTAEDFAKVFQQSLDRLGLSQVDYYHLWVCHTMEQYQEAFKPGGWYDGFLKEKAAGRVQHLGITTHADSDTIINYLKSGHFETVTLPLNITNLTRMKAVQYASEHGIKVIAMNPLGGGFLASHERLKELALRYLMALDNVHILIGFTSESDVDYAKWIEETSRQNPMSPEAILEEAGQIIGSSEPRCTGCGYCLPCPQKLEVGGILAHYNLYKYLNIESAKEQFNQIQWDPRYKLKNCTACGLCESRCPNQLPVRQILAQAREILY